MEEKFLTVRQAARILNISEVTLRKLVNQRQIRYHRWGPNRVKLREQDVLEYKNENYGPVDTLII